MESACRVYRPRNPRETPLWGLLDTLYERVKGVWEERFERKYGFWRGLADEAVARSLDRGVWDSGFARVKCRRCPQEFLVAFSCKGRGLCPSCGAKRAAELAAFLEHQAVPVHLNELARESPDLRPRIPGLRRRFGANGLLAHAAARLDPLAGSRGNPRRGAKDPARNEACSTFHDP